MNLLIICFKNNISQRIAGGLGCFGDVINLDSSKKVIESFVNTTNLSSYDYILGLGVYSGRDQYQIRIEKTCSSQFRNNRENYTKLNIPYWITPNSEIKYSDGIGNSYCNLLSFEILKKHTDAKYTFLHIPKNFSVDLAVRLISEQL